MKTVSKIVPPHEIRRSFFLVCILAIVSAGAERAHAQEATVIDRWADAIAESLSPRWVGPRVPWPQSQPRPPSQGRVDSTLYPLHVHAAQSEAARPTLEVMSALERAYEWMESNDWPLPASDGGAGGTAGFDLYLHRDRDHEGRPGSVSTEAPLLWGGLDASTTYASLDVARVPTERLAACTISVFARAALLSHDPAEAPAWRIATGDYIAWLLTGEFGCGRGVVRHQQNPGRTWIGHAEDSGEGGALMLALLSSRTDRLSGNFIRDVWSAAPQLTWEGAELRAAPDMWQALNRIMSVGEDPLIRLIEQWGVDRYFAGREDRAAAAPDLLLRALPPDAQVPLVGRTRWEDLPRRFEPHGLELEPYGSAYLEIDTRQAEAGDQLRVHLRGEYGVGWALTAVRLGASGAERGRVRAPVRPRNRRSYVPVELSDAETTKVVVVVTNLGNQLLDADEPDEQVRSFRLILDRASS